jgi:hypothetical protein
MLIYFIVLPQMKFHSSNMYLKNVSVSIHNLYMNN